MTYAIGQARTNLKNSSDMNYLFNKRDLTVLFIFIFMSNLFYGQIRGEFEFKTPDGNIILKYDTMNVNTDTLKVANGPYCEICKYYEGYSQFYMVFEDKYVLTFQSQKAFQRWVPVSDVEIWEGNYFFAGRMNQDQFEKFEKQISKKKRFEILHPGSFQIEDYKLYTLKDGGYLALKKRGGFHYYFPRLIDLLVFLNEV